jgi:hypothetical protein
MGHYVNFIFETSPLLGLGIGLGLGLGLGRM